MRIRAERLWRSATASRRPAPRAVRHPAERVPDPILRDASRLPDVGLDPCPWDAENLCLAQVDLEGDLDGDGVPNAIDVCVNDPDPLQTDSSGNGIGDACRRYANIRTPVSSVTVDPGMPVRFTSVSNDALGFVPPLHCLWSMDGGAPDSSAEQPGDVVFATPGVSTIRFTASDAAGTTSPLGPDVRVVTVLAGGPLLDPGGPFASSEGHPVVLTATTRGPPEPVAFQWEFGDGEVGQGNPFDAGLAAAGSDPRAGTAGGRCMLRSQPSRSRSGDRATQSRRRTSTRRAWPCAPMAR